MKPFDLLQKAAYCRRLARATTDAALGRALDELADDFEAAAFDSATRRNTPIARPSGRTTKLS
ncbi:MAG TPA: hypothetical protein VGU20_15435 [Stellaceae bacterium]|nr:hypothetical protein [Stellaceae bacterium]